MIESVEQFITLRNSENPIDYGRAADEPVADNVWPELIRHREMRTWAALNKHVPLCILSVLAKDEDPSVRAAVAMKRKLTPDLFMLLSKDPDSCVRMAIVNNRAAPIDVLVSLVNDPWVQLAEKVRAKLVESDKANPFNLCKARSMG